MSDGVVSQSVMGSDVACHEKVCIRLSTRELLLNGHSLPPNTPTFDFPFIHRTSHSLGGRRFLMFPNT
jgi:hypothetical protein